MLGVVQGVSEWLPISSKTQVIIASYYLFGFPFSEGYAFGLFLEAGTFFAAVFYFRKEVILVLRALVGKGDPTGRLLLKFLLVVTLITGLIGVAIYKLVSDVTTGPVIGIPMIFLGLVLIGDGLLIRLARGRWSPKKGLEDLTMRDLVVVGVAQGLAAFPGVSRSGATVSTMLLLGIKPESAFRLSFLALIPASVGASAVTVLFSSVQIGAAISAITVPVLAISIICTVLVGLALIRILLRFAGSNRITLLVFSLGVLAILSGVVSILTGVG